jgi:hypothetical protein
MKNVRRDKIHLETHRLESIIRININQEYFEITRIVFFVTVITITYA